MKEKNRKKLILTSIVTLLPMVAGLFLWNRLPEQVATHFGVNGEPNGWSSKGFAVFGLPLFIFAVHLLCTLATEKDPRSVGYPKAMKLLTLWICPVVSWICAAVTYGYALGWNTDGMGSVILLFLGFLLLIIGNYLPKIKQNYYLGIKLPWTYADEENWNKTHRLGGKVWVIGGLLILANYFLKVKGLEIVVLVAVILIPTIYSWAYSIRKDQK